MNNYQSNASASRIFTIITIVGFVLVACSSDKDFEIGKACTRSADCPGDRCLSGRCTRTCRDAGECTAGWSCAPATDGVDVCQCNPTPEVCDGRDNDCNGIVDDGCSGPGGCTAGLTMCAGACRNLLEDPFHCGGCANSCNGGTCVNGACECPAGTTRCGSSTCLDFKTDNDNCGACGVRCRGKTPSDSVRCQEGACSCADHRDTLCPDGRCVRPYDLCLNADCSSRCRPDQRCMLGSCVDQSDGG